MTQQVEKIIDRVCSGANITREQLFGDDRTMEIMRYRYILSHMLHQWGLNTVEIANICCRTHAAISTQLKQYHNEMATSPMFRELVAQIENSKD